MYNAIKMNLYRLFRTKTYYVLLVVLMLFSAFSSVLINFTAGSTDGEVSFLTVLLLGIGSSSTPLLIAIGVSIFVCSEYNSGYIKNTMSVTKNKTKIVFSSFVTLSIGILIYYIAMGISVLICSIIFVPKFVIGNASMVIMYFLVSYFMGIVLVALFSLISTVFRNTAGAITTSIMLIVFLPVIYMLIHEFLKINLAKYSTITSFGGLRADGTNWSEYTVFGLVFLIIYLVTSALVILKKDTK